MRFIVPSVATEIKRSPFERRRVCINVPDATSGWKHYATAGPELELLRPATVGRGSPIPSKRNAVDLLCDGYLRCEPDKAAGRRANCYQVNPKLLVVSRPRRQQEGDMNQQRIAVLAVLLLCSLRAVAGNQTALPNQGRVMWAAFECSTFAGYSDDKREAERLFNVGYRAGKEFFEKAEKGLISEAELRSATPSGVLMVGRGPTVDFRIGRVYEAAMSNAFDRVTKRGADGLPEVDPKKWITDDEVRSILAKGHYDRSNCALIR